jgi:tetratricopeptide (TPR) repeat protein
VASNPRIDDLRGRLEKDPGSRLFAQLAEELRKDGELEEAIRVSRAGLQRHPAYPSARMTLGRALLDTGDLAAARIEFETVLKGAPDNILASRFLGECLEGLGDLAGARDRFKATLALAPGDKQVTAHLQEVEAKLRQASGPSGATTAAGASRAASPEAPLAPIPVAQVAEPMELERSVEARPPSSRPAPAPSGSPEATVVMSSTPTIVIPPAAPAPAAGPPAAPKRDEPPEPSPIPLVAAEEDFELERAFEAPTVSVPPQAPETRGSAVLPAPPAPSYEPPAPPSEFEFDLAPDAGGAATVPEPWRPEPEAAPSAPPPEPEPEPQMEPPTPPPPPAVTAPVALPPIPPPPAAVREPERVVQAAPPLPPPVFAPTPPPPTAPRVEAPSPLPQGEAARAPAAQADELTSSTLAELYFNQGFTDKAIEVYRQLLQREPGNERARTRLGELEALERRIKDEESRAAPAPGDGAADPAAARRQAIERTIARLEGLLTALRKE